MIPKEIKYNLHYDDIWGETFYGRHTVQHQLQQSKMKVIKVPKITEYNIYLWN